MYLTIQGLVLRVNAYNDSDSLLTILTKEHGKITAKARGLRRKNSPLTAPCQLLAYSEFTLFEYRGFYTINEASSIELFQQLQTDLVKLSLATYFAQVAEVISQEDISNPELLSLVLNCLHILCHVDVSCDQVKAVFELRCACLAGYTPDLHGCQYCNHPLPDRFDVAQGQLECSRCSRPGVSGIRMPVNPGVLDSMRYICHCSPKRLFGFQVGESTVKSLSSVCECYLSTQLERGFSALDFYKSLFQPLDIID